MNREKAIEVARVWMVPELESLFAAEWANESWGGGISPATINSAIDSLTQAPDVFYPDPAVGFAATTALLGMKLYSRGDLQLNEVWAVEG